MDKVYNYDDQKPDDDDIDKDDDNTLGRNRNLHLSLSLSTLENSSTFACLAWCFEKRIVITSALVHCSFIDFNINRGIFAQRLSHWSLHSDIEK